MSLLRISIWIYVIQEGNPVEHFPSDCPFNGGSITQKNEQLYMWSGQHQQSANRIPPQLASIIMTKENVVFYSKTLDCFFYLFFSLFPLMVSVNINHLQSVSVKVGGIPSLEGSFSSFRPSSHSK